MPDQILNHTLKRLLLPNPLIPPLQPVLQHLARPQRRFLQPLDMILQLFIVHAFERSVSG